MPAKSSKQRKAAGVALAAKRGRIPKEELQGPAAGMAASMSERQLADYAKKKKRK